jgi:hypothetical protein
VRAFAAGAGAAAFLIDISDPAHPALRQIRRALSVSSPSDRCFAWDADGLDFAGLADSLGAASGAFGALDGAFVGSGGGGGDGG